MPPRPPATLAAPNRAEPVPRRPDPNRPVTGASALRLASQALDDPDSLTSAHTPARLQHALRLTT